MTVSSEDMKKEYSKFESGKITRDAYNTWLAANDAKLSETKKQLDEVLLKSRQQIWDKHKWTQEKEDIFQYSEEIKTYLEHNANGEGMDAAESKAALFDKDKKDTKRNFAFNFTSKQFVSVSADGHVTGYNNVKPHGMSDSERTNAVQEIEQYIRTHTFDELQKDQELEKFVDDVSTNKSPVRIATILLNKRKQDNQALVALETGGFVVVPVKPDEPLPAPASSPAVAQVPSGKGQGK